MSCTVRLRPKDGNGDPISTPGKWYLTNAPVGFVIGELEVSCDNFNWITVAGLPSNSIPLDNNCVDSNDVYVRGFDVTGTYTLKFVADLFADASQCNINCINCSTVVLTVLQHGDPEMVEICQAEYPSTNLYTLADVDCNLYDIGYAPGSPMDADFILAGSCGTKGNFIPADITPNTYNFLFTRITGDEDCDDCSLEFTLIVTEGVTGGSDQQAYVCSLAIP